MNKKTSIVWNLTRLCPWDCKFCCVNAIKTPNRVNGECDFNYKYQNELSYANKISIIDKLAKGNFSLDFSGGELFIDPLNAQVIKYASYRLGAENVSLSTSGAYLDDKTIADLKGKVNDIELTLDFHPDQDYELRPKGYHKCAAKTIDKLIESGFNVGVQTVLTKNNTGKHQLENLFNWILEHKVGGWSLLRYFPSGRGADDLSITPSHDEYCDIVSFISDLTKKSDINTHFQYLLPNHKGYSSECRCVKKSIGILPDGNVTSCFWALDHNMCAQQDKYFLGNILHDTLEDILDSPKSQYWANQNHNCQIFDLV